MKKVIRYAFGLFILIHALMLFALNPDTPFEKYNHKIWTTRHGLPHNTITAVVQDSRNYMWFGTGNGLVRFDGTRFTVFTKENAPGMLSNSITSLLAANDQTLWIGTHGGGVTVYDYRDESFRSYSTQNRLPDNFINGITQDSRGTIWLATMGSGLICYMNNMFVPINTLRGLSSNIVLAVYIDSKGELWAGTDNGLNHLDESGRITVYTLGDGLVDDYVTCIFEDSKTNLWIGTRSGISTRRRGRFTTITARMGLSDGMIHAVREDRDGLIWAVGDKGLNRIAKGKIARFTSAQGLSSDSLLCIYDDREGNLWLGTAGGGLNVLWDGKLEFYTVKDGLSNSYVKAIYGDRQGNLWIGTKGGGLNKLKAKKFTVYTKADGLSSNYIESLCGDKTGSLWIGTNNGLNRFKHGVFTVFTKRQGLSHDSIRALFADPAGRLWIGTYGGGVNLYENGKFRVLDKSRGLSNNFVLCINGDSFANTWIGTNDGLNRFRANRFDVFKKKDGLNGSMILDISPDSDGSLWIATNGGGLNRFERGRITKVETGDNIASSSIYRILDDEQGHLWLSSNNGVFSVSKGTLIRSSGRKENTPKYNFFNRNGDRKKVIFAGAGHTAGWKTEAGNIWLPTRKGLALIDLKKEGVGFSEKKPVLRGGKKRKPSAASYLKVVRPLRVVIEKVRVDGKPVKLKDFDICPSGTGDIEFFFTAPNFTAPENVSFMYRLRGSRRSFFAKQSYDTGWVDIGNQNSVAFRELPSDHYFFQVKALHSDKKWHYLNRAETSFYIEPGFFLSFRFWGIAAVVLALAMIYLPRYQEWLIARKYPLPDRRKTSSQPDRKSRELLNRLLQLMEGEKPYLDPRVTIQKMARELGVTREDLSGVINKEMYMNFNNFLNKYRVAEAKERLRDPEENRYVILKVAYDVGFNSKSSFNAAFKKFTNMSPSQYRKKFQPRGAGSL